MSDKIKMLQDFMDEIAREEAYDKFAHVTSETIFMVNYKEAAERYAAYREQIARKQGFDQGVEAMKAENHLNRRI